MSQQQDLAEEQFTSGLLEGARRLGVDISDEISSKLLAHFRILNKWADGLNLTTVREPVDMAERLYLDSAIISPWLPRRGRLVDVGSGAGFPGLVLKVCRPGMEVTLCEARRKKVSFLKQAARRMQVGKGLSIRWERVGWSKEAGRDALGAHFDEVTSRATFPPAEWVMRGSRMVAPGGRLWLYAGQPHGDGDSAQVGDRAWIERRCPDGFSVEDIIEYQLPLSGLSRTAVSFRRLQGSG